VPEDKNYEPDFVFLSSEPYNFTEKHVEEFRKMYPKAKRVILVDGEYFSWYGSKLVRSPWYFMKVLDDLQYDLENQGPVHLANTFYEPARD
jgi:hypothetical protein